MKKFWLYFSSAYGTLWFILFVLSIISASKVDAGPVGFFGFPIVSFLYALIKLKLTKKQPILKSSPEKNG